MMSFEGNPIESAAKGVTKGALEYSEEKIAAWVKKLINRQLAFIEDSETIDIVKQMRKTGEFEFFKEIVKEKELRIIFSVGLTLRKLESDGKHDLMIRSKRELRKKYDVTGLHIAEFVQAGLFGKYLAIVLEGLASKDKIENEVKVLFKNIDNVVMFIQADDDPEKKLAELISKLQANSPKIFMVCSAGSAMNICKDFKENVESKVSGYECEINETGKKRMFFFKRVG